MNITMAAGEIQRLLSSSKNVANETVWASSVPNFLVSSFYPLWSEAAEGFPRDRLRVMSSSRRPTPGLYKPFVEAVCNYSSSTFGVIGLPSEDLLLTPSAAEFWATVVNSTIQILADTNISLFGTAFQWVNFGDSYSTLPSAAALFFIRQTDLSAFPCTLNAVWVPSDPWIDPSEDNFVHDNTPNPLDIALTLRSSSIKEVLHFDMEWLSLLNVITDNRQSMAGIEEIGNLCAFTEAQAPTVSADALSQCLATGMALYLTDGLSRLQNAMLLLADIHNDVAQLGGDGQETISDMPISTTNTTTVKLQDSSHYQLVNTSIYRYRYGWGIGTQLGQGTDFTMTFAAVVLLLHILLALIHIVLVVYGGWRSNAWGKIGRTSRTCH
jgi:hypothetical protein